MKAVHIRQHYKYDCGAACLASIAAFYGIREPLAQIRIACGCTPEGISMQGIIDGAQQLGLTAKGYLSPDKDPNSLMEIPTPFIAHTRESDGSTHFVAVYKIGKNKLQCMDPAETGITSVSFQKFLERWTGYLISFTPGSGFLKKGTAPNFLLQIAPLFIRHKKELLLALLGSLCCTFSGISMTCLLQQIIDHLAAKGNTATVTAIGTLVFALTAVTLYLGYATTRYIIRCSLKMESTLTMEYIGKLFNLPAAFFGNYRSGDICSRGDDIRNIRSFLSEGAIGIATNTVTVVSSLVIMYMYNSTLAGYVVAFVPAYWLLYKLSGYLNRRYSKRIATANAAFESDLLDGIAGASAIRHYGGHSAMTGKLVWRYASLARAMEKSANAANMFETAVHAISKVMLCIIVTFGGGAILSNTLTPGELVGFYTLCSFFTIPLGGLINAGETVARTKVSCQRIFEILSMDDESCRPGKLRLKNLPGELQFRNVSFRYPGREMLFKNLDIRFPAGKITLVRGCNGSGKSTIAKLVLADYDPIEGSITCGGIPISQFHTGHWRSFIGYVPQSPYIFNATLLENIALGNSAGADIQTVMELCSKLGLEPLLNRLPGGIHANVGECSNGLSGGECQRIAIARALYTDASIYIFDEASSALDADGEKLLLETAAGLCRKGKTVIMISHKQIADDFAHNVVNI